MNTISKQMLHEFEALPSDMQNEVIDFVQFLKTKQQQQKPYDGQQVLALLREGRQQHRFSGIKVPAAWQKETRTNLIEISHAMLDKH